jgi:hypothetical protein
MVENYEFVLKEAAEVGMNEYDMSGAEGRAKRLEATDLVSDVTANTVIMKEDRHANYLVYKKIRNRVCLNFAYLKYNIYMQKWVLYVKTNLTGESKYANNRSVRLDLCSLAMGRLEKLEKVSSNDSVLSMLGFFV